MDNGVMMQYFHWYTPPDGSLYNEVAKNAPKLSTLGISAIWLPPACKGDSGKFSNGYDIYDLYDLGEFDQKGTVGTKFGTIEEYKKAIELIHENNMHVYVDVVLNHKAGADETENIIVRKVDPNDRNQYISDPFEINAYTKFSFPGRGNKYSDFEWNATCFTGVDYAVNLNETGIFIIQNNFGEGWEEVIDNEKGNYDYLMYADVEFRNEALREELKNWGKWYLEQVAFDGVRLDAVKHITPKFYNEWLTYLRTLKPELFAVGEYWAPGNLPLLLKYIEETGGRMSLFDSCLHHNLHRASNMGAEFDLRRIFDESLISVRPDLAVTVIDNHDTQPLQALEAPVEPWFKPLAYALILLRQEGYPCIFYPDLYGAHYVDKGHDGNDVEIFLAPCENLEMLLLARKNYCYGTQTDYFNDPNCVGWTREGHPDIPGSGCAVMISNAVEGSKKMHVGSAHTGKIFVDLLKKYPGEVVIDEEGNGEFQVSPGSVSVWVDKESLLK